MRSIGPLLQRFALATTFLIFTFSISAQNGTLTGKVTDVKGPLPFANVSIKGTTTGTTTDVNGKYSLEVAAGTHDIDVRFVGYTPQVKSVTVVAGQTLTMDFVLSQGISIDEVIVVGSRAVQRTQLESMVPVDVITQGVIASSPYGNVTHALQFVAPSFHSTPQTVSDGTDHIDPATLRGLGPDQVLVLVNGKRRHTSSLVNVNGTVGRGTVGTDLNAIPASSIKKIEILRDGAAAQYGSDAIAGVINVILKDNVDEATFTARAGMTAEGDGEEVQATANFGLPIGEKGGYINVTTDLLSRQATNRSGDYTGSVFGDSLNVNGVVYSDNNPSDLANFYAQTPFEGKQVMQIGNSELRNVGVTLNSAIPISENAEVYGNLMFNYRNGEARGFYRFPNSPTQVVSELHPLGFSPIISSDIMDNAFTLGARGKIGEWNADMSQTRGSNGFDFTIKNSNNASMGQSSPTQAYAGGFSYGQNTSNLGFTRKFDTSIPINVAFGAEFRLENFKIVPGEEASWIDGGDTLANGSGRAAGIQVFPGFQPQNALDKNRNNIGGYLDLEFDLTERWLLGLAARYENYSDFGDNLSYKIASRYKLGDKATIRGAFSTGFRAPSLHQIYFNNLSTQFVDINGVQTPTQVGTFNNESSVTRAFGIPSLKAETSQNISAGFTARLMPLLSLSVDVYQIKIEDRIVLSGRFDSGFEDVLQPLGASAAQFFTNAVNTTTQGVDIVVSYRYLIAEGKKLDFTLAGNVTQTEVDKRNGVPGINTSELLLGSENTLFNREEISRLEVAQPQQKFSLSANLTLNKFTAMLRATYFGEVTYIHPSDGDPANWVMNSATGRVETRDQVFSPKLIPDVELGYKASKTFKVALGAQNFTNTYPDKHTHSSNISSGRFVYSRRVQQFGVRGMFTYIKLTITL